MADVPAHHVGKVSKTNRGGERVFVHAGRKFSSESYEVICMNTSIDGVALSLNTCEAGLNS
jgi:hypothetical protein